MIANDPVKNHGRPLPPVESRWKKGMSGNPRGRPKKQDSLRSLLREELAKICPADREERTFAELFVQVTMQLAMKGNATALKIIWELLGGELDGGDREPAEIRVVYE